MTLLSDWLRKHFGAKPEPQPAPAVPAMAEERSVLSWDMATAHMPPVLESAGITAIMIRTDSSGVPCVLLGSLVPPSALRSLLDWAGQRLADMPAPTAN